MRPNIVLLQRTASDDWMWHSFQSWPAAAPEWGSFSTFCIKLNIVCSPKRHNRKDLISTLSSSTRREAKRWDRCIFSARPFLRRWAFWASGQGSTRTATTWRWPCTCGSGQCSLPVYRCVLRNLKVYNMTILVFLKEKRGFGVTIFKCQTRIPNWSLIFRSCCSIDSQKFSFVWNGTG